VLCTPIFAKGQGKTHGFSRFSIYQKERIFIMENTSHTVLPSYEITLYAQPYDICAKGFYFHNHEEFLTKSKALHNDYGQQVEEFEIQFIDGDDLDCQLFSILEIHQGDVGFFLTACESWNESQKINAIIAVGECGYDFDLAKDDPDSFEIELYELNSMKELAEQFVEEGVFGEIPENIRHYLDMDAIAYDLSMDYGEMQLFNKHYIYRCI